MLKISHTLRLPAIGSKNVIVSVMGDVSSIWFMHWNKNRRISDKKRPEGIFWIILLISVINMVFFLSSNLYLWSCMKTSCLWNVAWKSFFSILHESFNVQIKTPLEFPFLCRFYKICSYHIHIALKLFHSGLKTWG